MHGAVRQVVDYDLVRAATIASSASSANRQISRAAAMRDGADAFPPARCLPLRRGAPRNGARSDPRAHPSRARCRASARAQRLTHALANCWQFGEVGELAAMLGVYRSTLYRALARKEKAMCQSAESGPLSLPTSPFTAPSLLAASSPGAAQSSASPPACGEARLSCREKDRKAGPAWEPPYQGHSP
jgi:hypothetical protein